jgi:hypothetical protein
MNIINSSIIGGGLSSLIKLKMNPNSTVFCGNDNKIIKSLRFYENLNIGGNSNIWGGYINFKIYKSFKKNKNFLNFIKKQKLFKIRKLFSNSVFFNTHYISNYTNTNIFRITKEHFDNSLISKKIDKISIIKNKVILHSNNKKIFTKKLFICIGNLSLIKLLYNSNIITLNDKIDFIDGNVSYGFNFFLDLKKYYYIPMSLLEIFEKLFIKRKTKYDKMINKTLFVQKFSKKSIKYKYTVSDILNNNENANRYFVSHHLTNLRINNFPIDIFIKKYSKNIFVYNSGAIKKYLPGPISQNLIFNAITK